MAMQPFVITYRDRETGLERSTVMLEGSKEAVVERLRDEGFEKWFELISIREDRDARAAQPPQDPPATPGEAVAQELAALRARLDRLTIGTGDQTPRLRTNIGVWTIAFGVFLGLLLSSVFWLVVSGLFR